MFAGVARENFSIGTVASMRLIKSQELKSGVQMLFSTYHLIRDMYASIDPPQ